MLRVLFFQFAAQTYRNKQDVRLMGPKWKCCLGCVGMISVLTGLIDAIPYTWVLWQAYGSIEARNDRLVSEVCF